MAEKRIEFVIGVDTHKLDEKLKLVGFEMDQLTQKQKRLNKESGKGTAAFTKTTQILKEAKTEYNQLSKVIQKTNTIRYKETGHLETLKAKLYVTASAINKLSKAELEDYKVGGMLIRSKKQLTEELKKVEAAGGQHGRNVGNYTSVWSKWGASIGKVTQQLGMFFGIFQLIQGVKSSINVMKDFEQSVATLQSVLGTTRDNMSELITLSQELGRTTKYTAGEVISLQEALARLGFDQNEIKEMTFSVLNLATALNTDLKSSAELVGSTLRAYKLDATEGAMVSDLFAQATRKSALSFEKLSVALPIVGTVAKNAGVSLKTLVAQLGVAADRGMDASMAATSLRKVYLSLAKSGMTYEEAMKRISTATDKNKESLKIFGVRASTVGTILATSSEDVDKLTKSLENAAGATTEMADIQMDTLAGAILRVKSAWESFLLKLNETNSFTDKLKKTFNYLADNMEDVVHQVWLLIKAFAAYKAMQLSYFIGSALVSAYKSLRFAIYAAKVEQQKFNLTQNKNVYMAIAAALLYLGTLIYEYATKLTAAEKAQKSFNEELSKSVGESESLFTQLDKTAKGTKEYSNLIDRINQKYGEYLPYLIDEKTSLEELAHMRSIVNEGIEETIRLKILEEARSDIYTKKVKNEIAADKEYKQGLIDKTILTEQQINQIKDVIDEQAELTGNVLDYHKAIEEVLGQEIDWSKKGFWSKGMQTDVNRYIGDLIKGSREASLSIKDLNSLVGSETKPMFNFGPPKTGDDGNDGDKGDDELTNAYNKSLEQSLTNLNKYKLEYQKTMDENKNKLLINNEELINARKDVLDKEIAYTLQKYIDDKAKLKAKLEDEKITTEDYDNKKAIIYQNYLIKKETLQHKYNKDVDKINKSAIDLEKKNLNEKLSLDKKLNKIRYDLGVVSVNEYMKETQRIEIEKLKQTNDYIIASEEEKQLMIQSITIDNNNKIATIELKAAKERIRIKYQYITGMEKQMNNELLNAEITYLKKSTKYALMSEQEKLEAIEHLKREYQNKGHNNHDKSEKNWETKTKQEKIDFYVEQYNQVNNVMNEIMSSQIQQIANQASLELDILRQRFEDEKDIRQLNHDDKLNKLDLEYRAGLYSEEEYYKKKYAEESKFAKKEKALKDQQAKDDHEIRVRALEQQKKYQSAQVAINLASALIGIWSGYASLGPAGVAAALIESAALTVTAAVQTATINSQHLAGGGIIDGTSLSDGGLLSGALHTQGGINIGNGVEAESGEYVINRASTERYKPVLDYINSAGNSQNNTKDVKEIIDYERLISGLASVINNKKVILTQRDLVENENTRINIENVTTF